MLVMPPALFSPSNFLFKAGGGFSLVSGERKLTATSPFLVMHDAHRFAEQLTIVVFMLSTNR